MKPWQHADGISLIELLLVLVGISIITVTSISYYRQYQQTEEINLVKEDVRNIFYTVNNYFHESGCASDGIFSGNKTPDIKADLSLGALGDGRSPLVTAYAVQINETGATTDDSLPLYQLQITATLNGNFTEKQMDSVANRLDSATAVDHNHKITWVTAPNNNISSSHNSLWILAGARKAFRKVMNGEDDSTSSFCAQ
jgi:Tfp pilus assembly protein PilE